MAAPSNKDAALRAQILHSMNILDTTPEETFDRITRIASTALNMPIALVSLLDEDRQWFKSAHGLDLRETPLEHSFCQYASDDGSLLEVMDAADDVRFAQSPFVSGPTGIRFYAGVPVMSAEGVRIGTVCVLDRTPRSLLPGQRQILKDLAAIAAHELELRRIASTDSLTGAWNRRMLEIVATNEFHRARRVKRPFSIAVLDIDHFKGVNDRFGHEAGNDALFGFASTFRSVMRKEDWLFRIGGEEFAAILIGADGMAAAEALERFRREVADRDFAVSEGLFRMTASGAVIEAADLEGTPTGSLPGLLEKADRGLYQAKREGRNRIIRVA